MFYIICVLEKQEDKKKLNNQFNEINDSDIEKSFILSIDSIISLILKILI